MITKPKLLEALQTGRMTVQLSEWGDGQRGVGLYYAGDNTPIERIVCAPWHVDQDDHLQHAESSDGNWKHSVYNAYHLSKQARAYLVSWCQMYEDEIFAWCDGDETATIPAVPQPDLRTRKPAADLACTAS